RRASPRSSASSRRCDTTTPSGRITHRGECPHARPLARTDASAKLEEMHRNDLKLKRKTHVLARAHIRRFAHDEKRLMVFVYYRRVKRVIPVNVNVDGLFNVNGV